MESPTASFLLRGLWLPDRKSGMGMKVACRPPHLLQRLPILRKVLWGLRWSACNSCRAVSRSSAPSPRFALPEPLLGFLPSELLDRPRLGHRRGGLRLHLLALGSRTPQGRDLDSAATTEARVPGGKRTSAGHEAARVALLFATCRKPSLHLWFRTFADSAARPLLSTLQAAHSG